MLDGLTSSEHSEMVASKEVGSSIGEKTSAIVMPGLASCLAESSRNFRHILVLVNLTRTTEHAITNTTQIGYAHCTSNVSKRANDVRFGKRTPLIVQVLTTSKANGGMLVSVKTNRRASI